MILLKKNTAQRVGLRLLDSAGTAVTGVLSGAVTATVCKADGTTAAVTIAGGVTWTEVTTGAFSAKGFYVLYLSSGFFDQEGEFVLAVNGGTGTAVVTGWVSPVEADVTTISANVVEALGLLNKNTALSAQTYDGGGRLLTAEMRVYDTRANALVNNGVTGLLVIYDIAATYDVAGKNTSYKMTRRP